MLVNELLNTKIEALKLSDSIQNAKQKFAFANHTVLPVIDGDQMVVGVLTASELKKNNILNGLVSDYALKDSLPVQATSHIFEAARIMLGNNADYLVVTDYYGKYVNMIFKSALQKALLEMQNLDVNGAVISIDVSEKDYALSDIMRIIEMEGAKILAMSLQMPDAGSQRYRLSIKINTEDSSVVSAALNRYGYIITSEENSEMLEHELSERADELLRYLDI